jgi:hypothetical protein
MIMAMCLGMLWGSKSAISSISKEGKEKKRAGITDGVKGYDG